VAVKSLPVLQLLKKKFDAPEGAPVSKHIKGPSPSNIKKNDGFHLIH